MSDALRREYHGEGLTESDLAASPWEQARGWLDDAIYRSVERHDVPEPRSMSLATIDAAGRPDVRTVLMRFFDAAGPGFGSNLESFRIACDEVGLRAGRSNRLHDRLVFVRVGDGGLDDAPDRRVERRQP